jgi:phospholipid/cholesterol/gamma-HCH transport system substrate-binding protein
VRRNIELQVGSLVLVAIVAASFGLLFLKEFKFRTATWPVEVSFPEASGLSVGAPVLIRGVERGKVQSIRLERETVQVTLGIEEGTEISEDALFVIQPDMMGPTYVTVEQGSSGVVIEPGAQLTGVAHVELASLLENSAGLLVRMDRLTRRFDDLMSDGRLDTLAADISGGARELRLLAEVSRKTLPRSLEHLDLLTLELTTFIKETGPKLGSGLDRLNALSLQLETLSADLHDASGGLKYMSDQLESGQGTLGRLVAEDDLYVRLESTVIEVDSLIADIKANPRRYFNFELF